jgi:glycosyltransferase involved in cell wall biosynthesis
MKLLFVTQKIQKDDDDLAFVILWVEEFIRQGWEVEVICLGRGMFDDTFPVHSLGKEKGSGFLRRVFRFLKLAMTLKYDRVFIHMNPEYVTLAGWYWWLRRIPVYLWYTHYTMHIHLWLSGIICKRLFAATDQSLPQYANSPKKIITGHGIPINYWLAADTDRQPTDEKKILTVHRLSRSKRLQIGLKALSLLPPSYSLVVYGRALDPAYYTELNQIVDDCGIRERVTFCGPVPMDHLKRIYPLFRLMVNMASETIDKTMVEGMLFGIYPITTPGNSRAIGLPVYPRGETAEDIAAFIEEGAWSAYDKKCLQTIVVNRHSLVSTVREIGAYMEKGI